LRRLLIVRLHKILHTPTWPCATSARSGPCPSGIGRLRWPDLPFSSETASPSI